MTKKVPPFSPEVRARAVRMVLDHREEHGSQWAAIHSIASKIGCLGETLRNWVRQTERDEGLRPEERTTPGADILSLDTNHPSNTNGWLPPRRL